MRLPWPFGRGQRSPSEGGDTASGGAAASSAPRASGDAWRQLPPLAETVGPPPLVAPSRPFAAALASSEPPAPILAPLSHGRSLEAPRGLVTGVARPVAADRGPELPRAVQRSPLQPGRRAEGPEVEDEPEPTAQSQPDPIPARSPAPSITAELPARRLNATPPHAVQAPARAYTLAPEPVGRRPFGLVGQPHATRIGVQRAPEPGAATAEPSSPAPGAIVTAAAAAPAPTPAAAARSASDPDRPRLSIGQARRLGLGTPIAGGPLLSSTSALSLPAVPLRPSFEAPVLGGSSPTVPASIQRSPEPSAAEVPLAPAASHASHGHERGEGETRPVSEQPVIAGPTAAAPAPPIEAPVLARPVAAATAGPAMSGSPIISAQPLRARVQRAPLTLAAKAPDDGSGPGDSTVMAAQPGGSGAPVQVHRDGTAAQLSKSLDARSFTHGGEIYLPASHGPLTSGKGRSLLAHELTHVTQQRKLGSSLPQEHTPHGKALEAEAVAAERGSDLPLVQSGVPAAGKPEPATTTAVPDLSAVPAHGPATSGPTTGPAQRAPANAGSGTGNGSGDGSARKSHSEQELEDLANQLYSRIGRQLRRELLVDRERAGMAMDFR